MKSHYTMLHKESVRDACHCIFMNPRTLTIWCYHCDCELNPFIDGDLISPTGKLFLKTVVRCMQGKKSKQDGDGSIQDLDLPGLVGLKNLGNTCYMNAALQALSNTPALTYYFQTCEAFIPESRRIEYARQKNHMLVDSFFHFVNTMWSGKSAIFSPVHLVSDVKKCNDIFQGTAQQDSQEFLRCILDKLHDELTYPRRQLEPALSSPHIPILDEKSSKVKVQLPQPSSTSMNGTSKESSKSVSTKKGTGSSVSYSSSRSSSSSRSAQSSENSSLTENMEITPARATAPSIISEIFEGTLESRVRCLSCRKEYIKEDKFFDLSIPIDKKSKIIDDTIHDKSGNRDKDGGVFGSFVESIGGWFSMNNRNIKLQDCLASFCATEELTGEDRYRCTQCDALNDCRKTFRITQLPETLCIHLKRFRYDTYSSKINTYVQFPLEDLDMTPFFKSTDAAELKNTKYDLYAMVRHRGVVGGINVATTRNVMDMVMPIPRIAWDALVQIYGTDGSPIVTIRALESEEEMACEICAQEELELDERRRCEDEDVSRLDSNAIAEGQLWYLIGADWLKEWHAFKAGGTDYRGINRNVWNYLHGIYGGGPEFVRAALDLYAQDPKTVQASPTRSNFRGNISRHPNQHQYHGLHHNHHHYSHPHHQHHLRHVQHLPLQLTMPHTNQHPQAPPLYQQQAHNPQHHQQVQYQYQYQNGGSKRHEGGKHGPPGPVVSPAKTVLV
ncbi:Ubiquitin carboxyl-terminal hydrolase 33 [Mortierella sp. GBA30]|nr:Ubiquitin carboxyl-terminal hydrolase 33 [Mortierella sp. GBA30]